MADRRFSIEIKASESAPIKARISSTECREAKSSSLVGVSMP
jgi:hypothetical protein